MTLRGSVARFNFALWTILLLGTVAHCQTGSQDNSEKASDQEQQDKPELYSSPLQSAIARGMKPGGDLVEELDNLEDAPIRTRRDARAICEALKNLPTEKSERKRITSPLYELAALFQKVDSRTTPAFNVLSKEGIPQLIRIFDAKIKDAADDADDLLFLLKIFAMYESRDGAERIVAAARRPLKPDAYVWHAILSAFSDDHPHRDYLFEALSDPLPPGFIAVSLLDSANEAAREESIKRHPFDSQAGWKQLENWLRDSDPDDYSYAHSATASLPFMSNPARDRLLALAMQHPDQDVQMEAAWAAGKLGDDAGIKMLARFCLDVHHSSTAQDYLEELDREDAIPAAAKAPEFQARAEFSQWLAHPNELGQPPDELQVVDHRELTWPPEGETKSLWLIRYRLRDKTGLEEDDVDCGMVGSMTWCFFSYNMHQRPPEDAYAIHCYWELENAELIKEPDLSNPAEYSGMLSQWKGARLDEPKIVCVAELSSQLKAPQRRVALASAQLDGQEGWVVLDGPRSTWYPKSEQPEKTFETVVLKIHVGRQVLGFLDPPNRKKYLITDHPAREPQQIVAAFEKLMAEARDAKPKRQKELLGSWSLLSRHFDDYVQALAAVRNADRLEMVIDAYNRFQKLAEQADESIRNDVYDVSSVLGARFPGYSEALVERGKSDQVVELIGFFAPHWDNNLGYRQLGVAAFKAGRLEIAEPYLLKLKEGMEHYHRGDEMSLLAEIWHKRGESDKARELLVDCLQKLAADYQKSKYPSDRDTFADDFNYHRATYLRLFPNSEAELEKAGVPAVLRP